MCPDGLENNNSSTRIATFFEGRNFALASLSPSHTCVEKKNSFKSVLENFSSTAVLTERA